MTAVADRPTRANRYTTPWTDADHERGIAAYREHGCGRAARMTGIPKATLSRWASDAGVDPTPQTEEGRALVVAANEARLARCVTLRLEVREQLLVEAAAALERMHSPYIEFVGNSGKEVEYELPPANATWWLLKTVATAIDKYRLEMGEVTDRTELVGVEAAEAKAHLASVVEMAIERRAS